MQFGAELLTAMADCLNLTETDPSHIYGHEIK